MAAVQEMQPPVPHARLLTDLEFVQSLANPDYLGELAKRGLFEDKAFVNYLAYLKYFEQPEYSGLISYPSAFWILRMLQDEGFRKQLNTPEARTILREHLMLSWASNEEVNVNADDEARSDRWEALQALWTAPLREPSPLLFALDRLANGKEATGSLAASRYDTPAISPRGSPYKHSKPPSIGSGDGDVDMEACIESSMATSGQQ